MFSLIGTIFTVVCYQPLLNLLIFTYNVVPGNDIGLVIIIITLIIKLLLYPFSLSAIKAQKAMNELQPKINEVKEKYKDDKEKQAKELMLVYKENKINPFSSCLPLLIQLPFLIAIYQVFNVGLRNGELDLLYFFIEDPGKINTMAFGLIDMAKPFGIIAILAALAQYWQAKMMLKKRPEVKSKGAEDEDMAAIMSKQMTFMMPLMTVFIGWNLPAGLVFYWLLLTLFTGVQQFFTLRGDKKKELPVEVIDNK